MWNFVLKCLQTLKLFFSIKCFWPTRHLLFGRTRLFVNRIIWNFQNIIPVKCAILWQFLIWDATYRLHNIMTFMENLAFRCYQDWKNHINFVWKPKKKSNCHNLHMYVVNQCAKLEQIWSSHCPDVPITVNQLKSKMDATHTATWWSKKYVINL